jgi:hypothetical protein
MKFEDVQGVLASGGAVYRKAWGPGRRLMRHRDSLVAATDLFEDDWEVVMARQPEAAEREAAERGRFAELEARVTKLERDIGCFTGKAPLAVSISTFNPEEAARMSKEHKEQIKPGA